MQISSAARCGVTPTRVTIILKIESECWRGRGEIGPFVYRGDVKGASAPAACCGTAVWPSNPTPDWIPKTGNLFEQKLADTDSTAAVKTTQRRKCPSAHQVLWGWTLHTFIQWNVLSRRGWRACGWVHNSGEPWYSALSGRRQTQEAVCALDEVSKIDKIIWKADLWSSETAGDGGIWLPDE